MHAVRTQGCESRDIVAPGNDAQVHLISTLKNAADGYGLTVAAGASRIGRPRDRLRQVDTFGRSDRT